MPEGEPTHAEMIATQRRTLAMLLWLPIEDDRREDIPEARAILAHLERTQWRPIEEAPESVKDLARAAEESPGARLRFGFGFEIGPPMQAPCYAFWLNDKGYVTTFFALPPSPETP